MMIGRAAETRVPGHDEHIHVVADAAARYLIRDRDGKFPQLFDAVLDRTLIWDQRHLLHALREFETFYNGHRPHQCIANARPPAAPCTARKVIAAAERYYTWLSAVTGMLT
jgi:hypothetical protein